MPRSTVFAALVIPLICAWTRPQLPATTAKPVAAPGSRLDYVIVVVNGEPRLVKDGAELSVVRGDVVVLRDGALRDGKITPKELNLVGFPARLGRKQQLAGDDRGVRLDTATELGATWSEAGRGDTFAVLATSQGALHGAVYLKLIDPVLRYAELSVNGKPLVLRSGEPVTVGAKDKVKVVRVVTNLATDDGVTFQIVPQDAPGAFEIRFLRGARGFAAIPLRVKD